VDVRGRPLDTSVGDFFSDGPATMSWDEGDFGVEDHGEPRVLGTLSAGAAIVLLLGSFALYAFELHRGAAGADAGGVVLLSAIAWAFYLSLPPAQHHDSLIGFNDWLTGLLDSRVDPVRQRTEAQLALRRERDRYRAMRDERARRIAELGEAAYRQFRSGEAAPTLVANGQRVMAIEQQMLMQDARLHDMQAAAAAAGEQTAEPGEPGRVYAGGEDPDLPARPARRHGKRRRRRPTHR
jgi:hypothetical protein